LINNRQGGRRRGRGGQRNPNLGGNRQDNRQRGNAAQLLEKYKNMARDAQLAGDRVQAEYYLQFADHYFRVLGENRPRFDEQRPQRDDSSDEDEGDEQMADTSDDEQQQQQSNDRGERAERNERPERSSRSDRGERNDRGPRGNGRERPQRNGSQLAEAEPEIDDERIALEVLPPAIGRDSDDEGEAPAKPRRRVRKVRNDGDEADIAPAA
jgi:hypothetical protein